MVKERLRDKQEKAFKELQAEIAEFNQQNFATLDERRKGNFQKVQDKFAKLDKLGFAAYGEHLTEVEKKKVEKQAKDSGEEIGENLGSGISAGLKRAAKIGAVLAVAAKAFTFFTLSFRMVLRKMTSTKFFSL